MPDRGRAESVSCLRSCAAESSETDQSAEYLSHLLGCSFGEPKRGRARESDPVMSATGVHVLSTQVEGRQPRCPVGFAPRFLADRQVADSRERSVPASPPGPED